MSIGLGCALAAPTAVAAPRLKDRVQLSLSGTVLGYTSLTLKPDQPIQESSAPGAGPLAVMLPDQTTSTTSYGLPGSGLGFGLGVGVSDNVLLGAQLLASSSKTSVGDSNSDGTVIQFLPRLEYQFDGDAARPFIAAVVGVSHSSATASASQSIDGETYSRTTESSSTGYLFGGSVGVHAFLSDSLSIDPALMALGISGSQTDKDSAISPNVVSSSNQQNYSTSGYQVLLSIGLSAWLGGSPSHALAHPADADLASTAAPRPLAPPPEPAPEEEPLSVSLRFPGHRELYLQVASDPNLPTVIAHLYAREDDSVLTNCTDISVSENGQPLALHVTSRGKRPHGTRRRFVAGVIPVHALTVLARPDSVLSVCEEQWPLSPKERHRLHAFLAERNEISTRVTEPLEPEIAPSAPTEGAPDNAPTPNAPDGASAPNAPAPNAPALNEPAKGSTAPTVPPAAGSAVAPASRSPAPLPAKPHAAAPGGNPK